MSSYLFAKGVGESLNEDSYEVRIIRTAAGSDQTTEFSLAANGFALRYESRGQRAGAWHCALTLRGDDAVACSH